MWKGFITESKLYKNYPGRIKGYREGYDMTPMEQQRAMWFWLGFPRAWLRFFVLQPIQDKWRAWRATG